MSLFAALEILMDRKRFLHDDEGAGHFGL
jgi:hypothetical protein